VTGGGSASAASPASTLTTAGQQLIQTLLGLQPGLATSSASDATAALAQAWAGQPVQQVRPQTVHLLWPPCVAYADIIFVLLLLLLSFFSSPNLSGRRLDVYHTSTRGVALVRI